MQAPNKAHMDHRENKVRIFFSCIFTHPYNSKKNKIKIKMKNKSKKIEMTKLKEITAMVTEMTVGPRDNRCSFRARVREGRSSSVCVGLYAC